MAFVHHDGTRQFAATNTWLFPVCLVLVLVTIISLSCCEGVRRTSPSNLVFLSLFTIGESIMVGYCTLQYDADTVKLFTVLIFYIPLYFQRQYILNF